MTEDVYLTVITTTGTPHIGNYVGAIRPGIEASRDLETKHFYFLADYHSLAKNEDPEKIVCKETMTYSPSEGCVRDARVLLTPSVLPVKVGLLASRVALKECKSVSLHEHTEQIKTYVRRWNKEYKKIDIVRPYAKPGGHGEAAHEVVRSAGVVAAAFALGDRRRPSGELEP